MSAIKHDKSKFDQLDENLRQLVNGVQLEGISINAETQLKGILGIHDEALCSVHQNRVLESLQFQGMRQRFESVEDSHHKTFDWIFSDEAAIEPDGYTELHETTYSHWKLGKKEDAEKLRRQEAKKFITWLSSPSGIFHISGKLGSGKSTLLKFLYTNPCTRAELQKWAGESPIMRCFEPFNTDIYTKGPEKLVFTDFFFWKPGSEMQRSSNGLFRSLLHDILQACPELIPEVLPEHWMEVKKRPGQIQSVVNISSRTIEKALNSIILDWLAKKEYRFCFFIDALDEYDGSLTPQRDSSYLVHILRGWIKDSGGRLALCVSSREEPVFMDAFSPTRRLRLHNLTSLDMENYTRHALGNFLDEKIRDRLIDIIPHRAKGIFLWVVLVIKNIREIMPDGYITDDELNRILDDFPSGLEELFKCILKSMPKNNRKKTYQMLAMFQAGRIYKLDVPLLAFVSLDKYDQDSCFYLKDNFLKPWDGYLKNEDRTKYQNQLQRVCGGLFEIMFPSRSVWGITYTHRSVPEMFQAGELKEDMESALAGFDSGSALACLTLAQATCINELLGMADALFIDAAIVLLEIKKETKPYKSVEFADSQLRSIRAKDPTPQIRQRWGSQFYARRDIFYHSILCAAVHRGFDEYAFWKLKNDPTALKSPLERAIVADIALSRIHTGLCDLDTFFGTELFFSDSRTTFFSDQNFHLHSHPLTTIRLTIWERFLMSAFFKYWWPPEEYTYYPDNFNRIVEAFLQHGCALEFSAIVTDYTCSRVGGIVLSVGETKATFRLHGSDEPWTRHTQFKEGLARLRRAKGCEGDVHISLREWFETYDTENKERLLKLLDAHQKATSPAPTTKTLQRTDSLQVLILGMWLLRNRGVVGKFPVLN